MCNPLPLDMVPGRSVRTPELSRDLVALAMASNGLQPTSRGSSSGSRSSSLRFTEYVFGSNNTIKEMYLLEDVHTTHHREDLKHVYNFNFYQSSEVLCRYQVVCGKRKQMTDPVKLKRR